MEEMNGGVPQYPYGWIPYPPQPPRVKPTFPTGRRELIFGGLSIICGAVCCNFCLFGGLDLGASLAAILCILCSAGYLMGSGCRMDRYSGALLGLSIVIALGFARSDDSFVKFVMLMLLVLAVELGLCLLAGQGRYPAGSIRSLLDPFWTVFYMGLSQIGPAMRGAFQTLRGGGPAARKMLAVLLGLAVALPVTIVVTALLMSADAAFDGLIHLLPSLSLVELGVTVILGLALACVLYTQCVALRHMDKALTAERTAKRTLSHLTVNTVLGAVCLVYVVYLVSQLAYFVGGFSGLLPRGYTVAQYARRGFFEMAWLCAIDLGVIALAMGLARKKEGKAPLSTRLLCLAVGIVTVFLVVTASAKMFLYIDTYGLTRLRVLTEVVMVFLGMVTVLVCVWLFCPKLPYMKVVLLLALVMGAAVLWADVDTVVASYNVSAYQSGELETVDLEYLWTLNDAAVPYIAQLTEDDDPYVAAKAHQIMQRYSERIQDFRDWNYAAWRAEKVKVR